eukprot:gb/GECG01000860.1/.p1 GENE.gb/GECG01000860.1/~~gb/GECG01000860.1/.p1  ORF type:complete len:674 (+),score=55.57 gb/GECG01000860.1/:1-2022(+)
MATMNRNQVSRTSAANGRGVVADYGGGGISQMWETVSELHRGMKYTALLAVTGGTGWLLVQLSRQRNKRTASSILNLFGPIDSLRSIFLALRSKHLRNMLLFSVALAVVSREAARRVLWMPRFFRRGFTSVVSFFFVTLWAIYYHSRVKESPRVVYQRSMWNMAIMERFQIDHFRPVFWAFNTHAQTVLCNSLNKLDEVLKPFREFKREHLPAFDEGNYVVLDWGLDLGVQPLPDDAPVVLICHGIMGSAEDNYCRNIVSLCSQRGWRGVVHDRWRIDFGEYRDVKVAFDHIRERYPRAPLLAIGFSAGAHVLLSYLIEYRDKAPLVGAVVISPGLDLVKMITHLRRTNNTSYRMAMGFCVQSCVRRHIANDNVMDHARMKPVLDRMHEMGGHELYDSFLARLPTFSGKEKGVSNVEPQVPSTSHRGLAGIGYGLNWLPPADISRIASCDKMEPLEMDEYSPFGNGTEGHYQRTAANHLEKVEVPLLALAAEDDPLLPPSFHHAWERAAANNKHIVFAKTKRGGHCAWHEGLYPAGPSYAETFSVNFLAALLSAQSHTTFILDIVRRAGMSIFENGQQSPALPQLAPDNGYYFGDAEEDHHTGTGVSFGLPFEENSSREVARDSHSEGDRHSNSLFYPANVARIASSTNVHSFADGPTPSSPPGRSSTFGSPL